MVQGEKLAPVIKIRDSKPKYSFSNNKSDLNPPIGQPRNVVKSLSSNRSAKKTMTKNQQTITGYRNTQAFNKLKNLEDQYLPIKCSSKIEKDTTTRSPILRNNNFITINIDSKHSKKIPWILPPLDKRLTQNRTTRRSEFISVVHPALSPIEETQSPNPVTIKRREQNTHAPAIWRQKRSTHTG